VADPRENLGVGGGGGAPLGPLGGGPSLEDEEKAMQSGKWRMVVGMIVAVVAAIALLGWFLTQGGDTDTYRTFGQNVNGARQAHFDQFYGCALRGVDLRNLNKTQDLVDQIHRRAQQGQKRYAGLVNEQCMPKLVELKPTLDALIAPEDMREQLRSLSSAAAAVRDSWAAYIAYVNGLPPEEPYDPESEGAQEHVTKIAKGWFDYRSAHKAINDALRAKLNE
jgi:hypothetical protein